MLSLTEPGRLALERDMGERDARPAGAWASLSATGRGEPEPAAELMERVADAETPASG
ncbi:hypothetical protein [Streptomyces canus]|uniref:hypothetical protein n=1 Tax=Streptomyces canus TaxID=58343 RepID=UPI0027D796B6|nr:hypothetical protein [Streptomyces canus]